MILTLQLPPFANCACLFLVLMLSPCLLLLYSVLSTYPVLCYINKSLLNYNNINALYYDASLYIYITLRFMYNIILHIIANRTLISRLLIMYLTPFTFVMQFCLFLNIIFDSYFLIRCGDIESNPGPRNTMYQSLSICHWNLNGIAAHNYIKLSMLEAYNSVYNHDVICLSETFLDSIHPKDHQSLKLQGYEMIRADHPNNIKHGGVSIYYKEHLPLKVRYDISPLKECLVTEIKVNRQKCFVTCLYRSPSQSIDEFGTFCNGLEITLANLNLEPPFCSVVIGDFNAKCNNWCSDDISDHYGLEMDSLSTCNGFTQLIREATNFEPNKTPSCIDLIFTSQSNLVSDSSVHPSQYATCHHQIIFAKIDLEVHLPPTYKREV